MEFTYVTAADEAIMLPAAPDVSAEDVTKLSGWSDRPADQLAMWRLVGTRVQGSKETRTCPDCRGGKVLTCRGCHGHGAVTCTWCHGMGRNSCGSCGGSGSRMVTETTTNSDGSTSTNTRSETCMGCGGMGRVTCMSCMGSGHVTCGECGGSGEVICQTCSTAGTVDVFIERTFSESTVATQILPATLPGYPTPVPLGSGYIHLQPRAAATPFDSEVDQALLTARGIAAPSAQLFFVRQASVTLHTVRDRRRGEVAATFIDGEPTPLLTVHRLHADPAWTPDRERHLALAAFSCDVLAPLLLGLGFAVGQWPIGAGAAVVALGAGLLLCRNPVRAFRLAFLDLRCARHSAPATVRCAGCGKDLCHECLLPMLRCPTCGLLASRAVTHLLLDGRWVAMHGSTSAEGERVVEGSAP